MSQKKNKLEVVKRIAKLIEKELRKLNPLLANLIIPFMTPMLNKLTEADADKMFEYLKDIIKEVE